MTMKIVAFLLAFSSSAVLASNDVPQLRGAVMEQAVMSDPKTVEVKSDGGDKPSRRKFVKYESSQWEKVWIKNVDKWAEGKEICGILKSYHRDLLHDFLNITCTSRYLPPHDKWCLIDDEYRPLWYNTQERKKFELSWVSPVPAYAKVDAPKPVIPGPEHEKIVSKFTFKDETTGEEYVEYIEPLVSHLRFPLTHCINPTPDQPEYQYHYTTFRGWIIPPPPPRYDTRALYFDAGASSWGDGSGGPSLKYFVNMWMRHGYKFDEIYAFEMTTPSEAFYEKMPFDLRPTTHYQQCAVSSKPEDDTPETPFLPNLIKQKASNEDYVLFKLDIDSPAVENGNIDFILADNDNHIDELVWEHHISGNYLMTEWGPPEHQDQKTLGESYQYFLKMREKGIRAHSWV